METADDAWVAWDRIALASPDELCPGDRRLWAFGWLRTEINNGCFHQFFFKPAGDLALDAIEAARRAGVRSLASLIERACSHLGTTYPTERFGRQQVLDDLGHDLFALLEPLDSEYYGLEAREDLDATNPSRRASHPPSGHSVLAFGRDAACQRRFARVDSP